MSLTAGVASVTALSVASVSALCRSLGAVVASATGGVISEEVAVVGGATGRGRGLGLGFLAATITGFGMAGASSVASMTRVLSGTLIDGRCMKPRAQQMTIRCSNTDAIKTNNQPKDRRTRLTRCWVGGISAVMSASVNVTPLLGCASKGASRRVKWAF